MLEPMYEVDAVGGERAGDARPEVEGVVSNVDEERQNARMLLR